MLAFLYYILATILYIVAIPFLILISLFQKYRHSIPSRFFLYKNKRFKKNSIWFHSCSLGETAALSPFVKNAKDKGPHPKFFFQEMNKVANANPNGGWVEYYWTKPGDEKPSLKRSFIKKCGKYFVGAGVWKK